jgi:hypothetical protein
MLAPRRGRGGANAVVRFLLDALNRPGGTGDFGGAMRALGRDRAARGVVAVLSDFVTVKGEEAGLSYLMGTAGSPRDAYCLHVLAPGELDPAREGPRGLTGDLRLVGVEGGESVDVRVTPETIARYRAGLEAWRAGLRRDCLSRGLAYVMLPSDSAIAPLLTGALRRDGMLR